MACYIQRIKVSKERVSYDYMGSSEFEWGSVQSARAVIRFGKSKAEEIPGYYVLVAKKERIVRDALVMIAPDLDFGDGTNYFDIAKESLLDAIEKSHKGGGRFKEWTNFERMVGYKDHPAKISLDKECTPDDLTSNAWLCVDAFVHNEIRIGEGRRYDDKDAVIDGVNNHLSFMKRPHHGTPSVEELRETRLKNAVWMAFPASFLENLYTFSKFDEVKRLESVDESAIRMFDKIRFRDGSNIKSGKVVGILPEGIRIEANEKRFTIAAAQITKILA